jgi:hypothetical protein
MLPEPLPVDRRQPERQRKRRGGRRVTDQYWTVPEVAAELGMSERSVWRKYLEPLGGPRLLEYYDLQGMIRIKTSDLEAFLRRHFKPRPTDSV